MFDKYSLSDKYLIKVINYVSRNFYNLRQLNNFIIIFL
jgi:hypothetical protein